MATTFTLATFNCENLFQRFVFNENLKPEKKENAVKNGFMIEKALFTRIFPKERVLTAQAIKATGADIICLQEVESMDTIKNFNTGFLKSLYPYKYLIDGNDPRLIDVGILSKFPIESLVTHQYDKSADKKTIFSRDCLEATFNINGSPFTVFVNHFKSMLDKTAKTPEESRRNTAKRRKEQASRVAEIIRDRFGDNPGSHPWAVVGDFNDHPGSDTSLKALLGQDWLENVVERLPEDDQWTHWWDTTKVEEDERYKQIDYILLSASLASKNKDEQPLIVRKGLAKKAKRYNGARFKDVGASRPSASDHCPVAIKINL